MKLPEPIILFPKSLRAVPGCAETLEHYTVVACTTNLGASTSRPGHSSLKHCFTEVRDGHGDVIATYAYGPGGMSSEPYPHVSSARRFPFAVLTPMELRRIERAIRARGALPYKWGANDCCGSLVTAIQKDAGMPLPPEITQAAADIRNSPPLF